METGDDNYQSMMKELVRWFWLNYGFVYGGVDCMAIREAGGGMTCEQRCWKLMEDVYVKVTDILDVRGVDITYKGGHEIGDGNYFPGN
jgi:hypothetical protein